MGLGQGARALVLAGGCSVPGRIIADFGDSCLCLLLAGHVRGHVAAAIGVGLAVGSRAGAVASGKGK